MSDLIAGELDHDEKIVWTGQPAPGRYAWFYGKNDFIGSTVGLAFAIFWTFMAVRTIGPKSELPFMLFPLIGVVMIVYSLYNMSSPIRYYLEARKTMYALTTKRAVKIASRSKKKVESTYFPQFANIMAQADSRGAGDIYFKTRSAKSLGSRYAAPHPDGFIGILDVSHVDRLIRQEFQKNVAVKLQTS